MSFQEIIVEVRNKPELWLSSHSLYKNRKARAKVWKELATKLGIKEDILKKRWKHLKDQYRKELKKPPVLRSGRKSRSRRSTWQYYKIMSFVKDEIGPAPSTGDWDVNETGSTHKSDNTDTESDTDTTGSGTFARSNHVQTAGSSGFQLSSASRKRSSIKYDMLEIERKKLSLMETRFKDSQHDEKLNNDEDYLFLKSILHSMKKLNEFQKLRFRGKINDWLLEALTENERALPSSSAITRGCNTQPHWEELIKTPSDDVE